MIASLPMYDRPEVQGATDRLWQAIRQNLGYGPGQLCRDGDVWDHWQSPDLILSQTCGYPYRAHLHGKVTLVGSPDYGLEGCGPGEYCSVFVARQDDVRTDPADFARSIFAYSESLSQSGWAAPAASAEARGFTFANVLRTGGHHASARAVAEERADLAALDAQSWRLMTRFDAFADRLHVIGATPPTPGLPFITAFSQNPDLIFQACRTAIDEMTADDRTALSLRGIVRIPADAYLAVPTPAPPPA